MAIASWIPKATVVDRIKVKERSGVRSRLESVSLASGRHGFPHHRCLIAKKDLCAVSPSGPRFKATSLSLDPKAELHRMQVSWKHWLRLT